MKKLAQNYHVFILFAFLLVMGSCVKEMDFDGAKNITLEPEMEIDLMRAKITTEEIVARVDEAVKGKGLPDDALEVKYTDEFTIPPQTAPVDITSEERIIEYLKSAALDFKIINTTPRDIKIKLILKKGDGGVIDIIEETVKTPTEEDDPVEVTLLFENKTKVDDLKELRKVDVDIIVLKGTDLRTDESGSFELTSSGIFKFEYDTSNGLP